jgi:hypothetical protein
MITTEMKAYEGISVSPVFVGRKRLPSKPMLTNLVLGVLSATVYGQYLSTIPA